MNPTDTEFEASHAITTIACLVFGFLFVGFALLSTLLGDAFVTAVLSFFGG
ncbi:MAG: hypothetical protein WCA85_25960 [Paraburkholderia sp.]|uniref:hypothetical protein n=1 Tax=Paraburkholderia sp. TaxID=1926495 RepID=UPI003C660900